MQDMYSTGAGEGMLKLVPRAVVELYSSRQRPAPADPDSLIRPVGGQVYEGSAAENELDLAFPLVQHRHGVVLFADISGG